jgi:zinc protease
LADAVWGGAAGARLGSNIREDKGYSYGVFSFVVPRSQYATWTASGGIQTNKTKEAVIEFQKELKFIAGQKPVSEKELADARNNRVRGYAQEFESLRDVGGQVVTLWTLGLPASELQRQVEEFQKATREAVNAAAEKYAAPGKVTLLLVGDLSKIEAGIRELNLGEVVILDAEGKPVRK